MTPHQKHLKMTKKSWLYLALIIVGMYWLLGCASCPRGGCPATHGKNKMSGYGQAGYGKPLCPIANCTYFSGWSYLNGSVCVCYKHSIDDYREQDSVLWIAYKKEMVFGYSN